MGERQNDGGPAGRRRAHPGTSAPPGPGGPGSVTGGRRVVDAADLEALLAAALIRRDVDAGAEQRAVAAFLTARESGAHGARTRRRDDWRTRRSRLGRHSLKATLSLVAAGLTLSGVAVAGIGATAGAPDGPTQDDRGTHAPSPGAAGPSIGPSTSPSTGGPADPDTGTDRPDRPGRPRTAGDTEAHCRAYEQVRGRGKALDSTAWKRLTEAAGGAENVDAYCAGQSEGTGAGAPPATTGAPPATTGAPPATTGAPERKGDDAAGRSGNGSSGNAGDNATRGAGNGPDGSAGKPGSPGADRP
ncbi:hypothetical protein ADK41_22330 [Streptomyces caelestis]|uniref:Uncharacterized protein n=1 Tax=Streptomyces caelestis TaxID=36816 RepID=A0A0M8QNH7_9ACTN|nr:MULTISPECIES: hypothetical protein [Streptomyces]KOT36576.1 hypothetical protein ADK41_22330 [Streptomyces caelestis]